ncbi:hypothetical protein ADK55_15045 [Streptomyces sp. WM4235]|nr:hypothetical protein ADK55_15045 [Streptomyces sp. WM4235]
MADVGVVGAGSSTSTDVATDVATPFVPAVPVPAAVAVVIVSMSSPQALARTVVDRFGRIRKE